LFQQKSQKSYPKQFLNGDFTSLLQSYGKKSPNKKKNNQNIQVFFFTTSLSSIPSSILPIHPFASGQNTPPAKFTTAILPCSPCRRKTASTAERDPRDPVVEGVGQAIGSKAQAPDFNLRYRKRKSRVK